MPNIIIKLPEGVFDEAARKRLAQGVTAAAKQIEQIGDDPRQEALTLVTIEEVKAGYLFAGGNDPLIRVIPIAVFFHAPEGVIDAARRGDAVRLVHEAVAAAKPMSDMRAVTTSVVIADVADGTWGANGQLLTLPDFARRAGYKHLQHLVGA
jgi:phenylpyruvate tautomerase PptA (4-oxalocrotonate tautomerase family)